MSKFFSVAEVARRLGVRPRDISDLFYQCRLSDEECPLVGGRRLIPVDYVEEIEAVLAAEKIEQDQDQDDQAAPKDSDS